MHFVARNINLQPNWLIVACSFEKLIHRDAIYVCDGRWQRWQPPGVPYHHRQSHCIVNWTANSEMISGSGKLVLCTNHLRISNNSIVFNACFFYFLIYFFFFMFYCFAYSSIGLRVAIVNREWPYLLLRSTSVGFVLLFDSSVLYGLLIEKYLCSFEDLFLGQNIILFAEAQLHRVARM